MSPVSCAFEFSSFFEEENWNCQTMNELRDMLDYKDRNGDVSIGIVRIPEQAGEYGHLVLLWYKERGNTSNAYILCEDEKIRPLTLDVAERIIKFRSMNNGITRDS